MKVIVTTDVKKLQYDINRIAAIISALLSSGLVMAGMRLRARTHARKMNFSTSLRVL